MGSKVISFRVTDTELNSIRERNIKEGKTPAELAKESALGRTHVKQGESQSPTAQQKGDTTTPAPASTEPPKVAVMLDGEQTKEEPSSREAADFRRAIEDFERGIGATLTRLESTIGAVCSASREREPSASGNSTVYRCRVWSCGYETLDVGGFIEHRVSHVTKSKEAPAPEQHAHLEGHPLPNRDKHAKESLQLVGDPANSSQTAGESESTFDRAMKLIAFMAGVEVVTAVISSSSDRKGGNNPSLWSANPEIVNSPSSGNAANPSESSNTEAQTADEYAKRKYGV